MSTSGAGFTTEHEAALASGAVSAAADPLTEPWALADIAYRFPSLRDSILANPSIYPELHSWILAQPRAAAQFVPVAAAASRPGPTKRPGVSPWVAVAIAAGILLVGVLIVVSTVVADGVTHLASGHTSSQTAPSAAGSPAANDPYAPAPGEAVFGSASVADAFFTPGQANGFGRATRGSVVRSAVGEDSAELAQLWTTHAAEPSDTTCRFAASAVPVFGDEQPAAASESVANMTDVATIASASTVGQSARVFSSTAEASAYVKRLQASVAACSTLDVGDLTGTLTYDLAGTIAQTAAWKIDGTFGGVAGTLSVSDMRHDNLVLRTTIFVAAADDDAVSDSVIHSIQDRAEQNLIDTKP